MKQGRAKRQRGFTLLELGIVLAVTAVLAAMIVPDMIELARNRMAQKAAEDVGRVQEAAGWYFYENASADAAYLAAWPGETAPNTCAEGTGAASAEAKLRDEGYLGASALTNPWGQPYDVSLSQGADASICSLVVATSVPEQVQNLVASLVTGGSCGTACPGTAPAGMARCCSAIPKPGGEAAVRVAFDQLKYQWVPDNALSRVTAVAPTGACVVSGCAVGSSCRACSVTYSIPLSAGGTQLKRTNTACTCGYPGTGCGGTPSQYSCAN